MNIKQLLTKFILVAMLLAPTQAQAIGSWWTDYKEYFGISNTQLVFAGTVCLFSAGIGELAKIGPICIEHKFNQALKSKTLTQLKWLRYGLTTDTQSNYILRAARDGDLTTVKLLLQCGVSPNALENDITSPLIEAAKNGHREIVILLLDFGAKSNFKNKDGRTALFVTVLDFYGKINNILSPTESDHLRVNEIIHTLLCYKADPNIQDKHLQSALMYASFSGRARIVQQLLENGAKFNQKDKSGLTAQDYARKNSDAQTQKDTCAVLENHINKIGDARRKRTVRMLGLAEHQLDETTRKHIAEYAYPQITLGRAYKS